MGIGRVLIDLFLVLCNVGIRRLDLRFHTQFGGILYGFCLFVRFRAADYSPFLGIEKGAVLQEARVFHDPQLDARRCSQVDDLTISISIWPLIFLFNVFIIFCFIISTRLLQNCCIYSIKEKHLPRLGFDIAAFLLALVMGIF